MRTPDAVYACITCGDHFKTEEGQRDCRFCPSCEEAQAVETTSPYLPIG